jgi:hypothetical protein
MTPTLEARNAEIADRMLWKDASAPVRAECLNHLREAARAGAEAQRALSKHIDQDGVYEDGDQHNEFECRNFGGRCASLVTEEKP